MWPTKTRSVGWENIPVYEADMSLDLFSLFRIILKWYLNAENCLYNCVSAILLQLWGKLPYMTFSDWNNSSSLRLILQAEVLRKNITSIRYQVNFCYVLMKSFQSRSSRPMTCPSSSTPAHLQVCLFNFNTYIYDLNPI